MYENLTRLDLVGPALARALGDPGWERLEASLVSGGKVQPDLRAHQRRGRGRAAQAAGRATAATGARHGPGGPGAARAGRHRRPGPGHPVRGRWRVDRRSVLRDGEGRRVRRPRRSSRRVRGVAGPPRACRPDRWPGRSSAISAARSTGSPPTASPCSPKVAGRTGRDRGCRSGPGRPLTCPAASPCCGCDSALANRLEDTSTDTSALRYSRRPRKPVR